MISSKTVTSECEDSGYPIKITVKCHIMAVRVTIIKKTGDKSVGEDVEKRQRLYTIAGNINWCSRYGKQHGNSLKD